MSVLQHMARSGNTPVFAYIQKLLLKVQRHPVLFNVTTEIQTVTTIHSIAILSNFDNS